MVITVTINPAMDKTLIVEDFSLGKVNRSTSVRYDIGGKGINVSKVLKNFNIESICTGFIGGIWENNFKKELKKRKIATSFTQIKGNTRTNTKIVDTIKNIFTDINEAGPWIDQEDIRIFLQDFSGKCNKGDIVVLSGGVGPSIPSNIYLVMTSIAKEKGSFVILDADGELLKEGIKGKPDIIKPNEHEIRALLNIDEGDDEAILNGAQKLILEGISKILISMGEKGAYLITEKGMFFSEGIRVPVKSTVGAGDSMVAALVYSILNKLEDKEALRFANACGAASVSLEGTEACTMEQVMGLLKEIKAIGKEVI